MKEIHFIAGLPRSGSTLLASLLRQDPSIEASMSSPVGGIFTAVQVAVSRGNEAAMFLSDGQRERLLRHVFDECYAQSRPIVFDTNRMWPAKLPTLVKLFPNCKMLCCVRALPWIVDSIERLIRRNALELSGIFGFESGGNVYSRSRGLCSPTGMVGFALDALKEAFYGEHKDRLMFVEYDALAMEPLQTMRIIYDWLKLTSFTPDIENIKQIPGASDFDRKLGTPGLHRLGSRVEWKQKTTIIPPDLFNSFPASFWIENNSHVPVICRNGKQLKAA